MGTIFIDRHFSPFDILVKNFFQKEEEFTTPNNRIINHPVDIYEDADGLYFDIACTGLTKKQIDIKVDEDRHIHHSGIAKRSFNLGWKIARRFELAKIEATMTAGLLKLFIPLTPESKPKTVSIK